MKPIGKWIVAKSLVGGEKKSEAGIILDNATSVRESKRATVIAIGPDVTLVKEGDVVEVREKSRQMPIVIAARESGERDIPEYLAEDAAGFKVTFVRVPKLEDVPYPVQMEPNLVIEYYSR